MEKQSHCNFFQPANFSDLLPETGVPGNSESALQNTAFESVALEGSGNGTDLSPIVSQQPLALQEDLMEWSPETEPQTGGENHEDGGAPMFFPTKRPEQHLGG